MQHSKPRLTPTIEPMVRHNIVHHENPPGEKGNNIANWVRPQYYTITMVNNRHAHWSMVNIMSLFMYNCFLYRIIYFGNNLFWWFPLYILLTTNNVAPTCQCIKSSILDFITSDESLNILHAADAHMSKLWLDLQGILQSPPKN